MSATASSSARFRPLTFGVTRAVTRSGAKGVTYLRAEQDLGAFPIRITDRLIHWAETAPDRTFMARREGGGDWRHVSYQAALAAARSIGQALLDRGLTPERPVLILSENDLEHALLALGCLYAGVPFSPLSPAYSLVSKDFEKLRHAVKTLTPGLVFASDPRYEPAIAATIGADVEVVLGKGRLEGRASTDFADLVATEASPAVDAAMQATGPDTMTKFLFTSGSTKLPKAVINTQRMWCANQQQMCESMPVLAEEPPVLVDWLPWNHTFGGNHNVGLTLYNGGTLYIDDGKPTPALIGETLRNLREISPTVYFNVPTGFEAIAYAMQTDDALRKTLLARAKMFFYAGASLAQPVWDTLFAVQEREIGERIVMATGLGMTESGPFGLLVTNPQVESGHLGLPTPGLELKLVDVEGKTEVRYRGPNITPGYWRAPEATREAFDDEGFFCTGDAVAWIDPENIHLGLRFDGRIAEDFKLATGTFVNVGPLRATIIAAGAPHVQDVVLTGLNQKEVGALIFIVPSTCRALSGLQHDAGYAEIAASLQVQAAMAELVRKLALTATGSARRIARALVMTEPPSLDRGEVTDKGSINQRAVLTHRATSVESLHADTADRILKP